MAKKFVRGITDVKTINNQDFDTNNVNDLLSDGQYNYIHRKKGKTEEYHNLTDNIKTISSDNTELLSVTNYNKTTNTATLHPKHDKQKEQVLESTRDTIAINHGTNGTAEKTTVDTNPQKVLEHENLCVGDGLSVSHSGNKSSIKIEPTFKESGLNLDNLENGVVRGTGFTSSISQSATGAEATFLTLQITNNSKVQFSIRESLASPGKAIAEYRFITAGVSTNWMTAPTSMNEITSLLAQKQDVLTAGTGITIQGNTISATAPVQGASVSIQGFSSHGEFNAVRQVVTIGQKTLTTFSFELYNENTEIVLTGELKEELGKFIGPGYSASNGAITIANDGTTMKLLNSTPEYHNIQHATFSFNRVTAAGGGDTPSN